jgi:hypothetical protein
MHWAHPKMVQDFTFQCLNSEAIFHFIEWEVLEFLTFISASDLTFELPYALALILTQVKSYLS